MFPRELYAPVNKEREKVPFFQSSNKKLLKEWKCFLANYILLRYILHTERGRERGREKVPFFQSMFPGQETFEEMKTKRNERGKEGIFPRELYVPANRERERGKKYHFSSRCSLNKKFLKEWKCFLANYILLRTQRKKERENERKYYFSS